MPWSQEREGFYAYYLEEYLKWSRFVTLRKCFSHPSLVIKFSNHTHKTKTKIGGRLLIASRLAQSNYIQPINSRCQGFACAIYRPQHPVQKCWTRTILLSQTRCFDFSKSNFLLKGFILSVVGAVLTILVSRGTLHLVRFLSTGRSGRDLKLTSGS